MLVFEQVSALRGQVAEWRRQGQRIGFVPTMGNLHAGHHSLVELARRHADRIVASIFVNPTQFGPNEDYARYPRTPEQDDAGLTRAGCDALLRPSVAEMYPYGADRCVQVEVPGLSDVLCGAFRPGHFAGVATVVTRLLGMVQPDVAVFGRKDLQQLQMIRYLVRDLALPVHIVDAPTARDADGLALSSRNQYLSADERALAPIVHRTLGTMLDGIAHGDAVEHVEARAVAALAHAGFSPDYAVVRDENDLATPLHGVAGPRPGLVALVAAKLGRTRLIDNLALAER